MREAWTVALNSGLYIIVVIVPPKDTIANPSLVETRIVESAKAFRIRIVNVRDVVEICDLQEVAATQYEDDRHIHESSLIQAELAKQIHQVALEACNKTEQRNVSLPISGFWRWVPASVLGESNNIETISNSLVSIDVLRLKPHAAAVAIPFPVTKVIAGIAATRDAGNMWCGHLFCPTVSARMERASNFQFLLRIARIPCLRRNIEGVQSAPDWAIPGGAWRDHGAAENKEPGDVLLFGLLAE
jgi:hypothetical protein